MSVDRKSKSNIVQWEITTSSVTTDTRDSTGLTRGKMASRGHPLEVYYLALCATVGGALYGYNLGVINGANLLIHEEFKLDEKWIEHIVSSLVGAAAVFALFAGPISDTIGRKASIMISAIIFTVGGVLMGVATGPYMLLAGRITVGVACGLVSSVVPVYVSECSPANIRGCLVTLNQLFCTLGIWLSAVLASMFLNMDHGWRYMLGLSALPGIVQFMLFLDLPESPRYLVMKNNIPKAKQILEKIRDSNDVSEELTDIIVSIEAEREVKGCEVYKRIFTTPHIRYTLFLGCMLQFYQQFSGINTVVHYSANILKSAGFDVKLAIWLSVIPFTVNFLASFIGLWAVEALGRTRALSASFLAIAIAQVVLVAAFLPVYISPPATSIEFEPQLNGSNHCEKFTDCWHCIKDVHCGFCAYQEGYSTVLNASCVQAAPDRDMERFARHGRCAKDEKTEMFAAGSEYYYNYGYCPSDYAWLAVFGLMLFVLGFAPGAGPIPWTINSEIYPLWCRGVATSIAAMVNWSSNYIVSYLFLTVSKAISTWGTFLAFSVTCVTASIFVRTLVPETKDRSLEEIELLFMSRGSREQYTATRLSLGHQEHQQQRQQKHQGKNGRLSQDKTDAVNDFSSGSFNAF